MNANCLFSPSPQPPRLFPLRSTSSLSPSVYRRTGVSVSDDVAVECRNLCFSATTRPGISVPILRDCSFRIPSGQLWMLLGPNGCGKSTLLKILAGVVNPTSGNIFVEKPKNFVFQNPDHQVVMPTVEADVAFGLGKYPDISLEEVKSRVITALDAVGMRDYMQRPIQTLSGGQKQRVAIAGALAEACKVLLLDELTTFLDESDQLGVIKAVKELINAKKQKMKILSRPTFISILYLIYLITIPPVSSSSPALTVPQHFLQCLDTQPADHGSPNSATAVIPTNSSFSANLMSAVRNLRFASASNRKPEAIVAALTETHIRATISCCKLLNLELRVRSGGHDYEGFSYTSPVPFVILDMYNFHKIDINIADETAWVQAGASLGEVYYNIARKSNVHAFPAGVCPKVGAGGHFSGGGFGNLMRKYGLSIDHIIDAQIMDANGKVYRDRRSMGEDVFWAIRGGGGGSYGVILAWKLKLVRVPERVTVFKLERTVREGAVDLVHKWQEVAPVIDRDLFIRLEIKPINQKTSKGKTIKVSFIGMFLGTPERLLNITKKSFPELHLTTSDCMVKKWIDTVVFWANYPEKAPIEILLKRISANEYYWKRTSDFVQTHISKEGLAKIFQTMIDHSPLPRRVWMQWNPWGGRMGEIPSDATAFVHRGGNLFMIEHFMNWYRPGDELEEKFLAIARSFKEAMAPYVSKNPREAFFNYRDVDIGITVPGYNATYEGAKVYGEKYFKGNYLRLVKIKARFDRTNFFRSQQGIPVLA